MAAEPPGVSVGRPPLGAGAAAAREAESARLTEVERLLRCNFLQREQPALGPRGRAWLPAASQGSAPFHLGWEGGQQVALGTRSDTL